MVDTAYEPTRGVCDGFLAKIGIETTYFDPMIGAGIAGLIRPNTKAIYLESPGSLTFETQDIPAIVAVARARNCLTLIDNTWADRRCSSSRRNSASISHLCRDQIHLRHSDRDDGASSPARPACTTRSPRWPTAPHGWARRSRPTIATRRCVACGPCMRG